MINPTPDITFAGMLQEQSSRADKAESKLQEGQGATREAFQQASAHARSAQQAEARCQVLEQALQRAQRKAETSAHLQQVTCSAFGNSLPALMTAMF